MQRESKSSVLIKFTKSSEDPEKGQKQVISKMRIQKTKARSKQTSIGECAKHSKVDEVKKLYKVKHSASQTEIQ